MRKQREETYTEERRRIIEQLSCNECGMTVDLESQTRRPEGWVTVYTQDGGFNRAWDFDDWECLMVWVNAHQSGPPSKLQEDLEASVAALTK